MKGMRVKLELSSGSPLDTRYSNHTAVPFLADAQNMNRGKRTSAGPFHEYISLATKSTRVRNFSRTGTGLHAFGRRLKEMQICA